MVIMKLLKTVEKQMCMGKLNLSNTKMGLRVAVLFFGVMLNYQPLLAQDEDLLGDEEPTASTKAAKVDFAFKTTKVVNLQSLEITDPGVLDFKMMHRFGPLNSGPYKAFGLDLATARFGFEYGIVKNLMVSAGRSNVSGNKNIDALLKYRLLHQNTTNSIPISLEFVAGSQYLLGSQYANFTDQERSSYFGQMIIGRKFDEDLSIILSPTYLMNATTAKDITQQFALGMGLRHKVSVRSSINLEYIPILTNKGDVVNSFSIGMDVETGGHVFQFHITNSVGLNEAQFISNTNDTWKNQGIRFGFNLSRVFTLVKPKTFKSSK
jgi:hypothetical protein